MSLGHVLHFGDQPLSEYAEGGVHGARFGSLPRVEQAANGLFVGVQFFGDFDFGPSGAFEGFVDGVFGDDFAGDGDQVLPVGRFAGAGQFLAVGDKAGDHFVETVLGFEEGVFEVFAVGGAVGQIGEGDDVAPAFVLFNVGRVGQLFRFHDVMPLCLSLSRGVACFNVKGWPPLEGGRVKSELFEHGVFEADADFLFAILDGGAFVSVADGAVASFAVFLVEGDGNPIIFPVFLQFLFEFVSSHCLAPLTLNLLSDKNVRASRGIGQKFPISGRAA